jgi:tripartite-type tricarboxylate transporter receptor subunit TctC
MRLPRRRFLQQAVEAAARCIISAMLIALFVHGAFAQTNRTIKIIVPYPAGGIADILARSLADQIGRMQSLTMIIEDRPGASGDIGTETASRAAPDGKTLVIFGNPQVISPHLRKLNYDPLTSFEPICQLTTTPTVIAVNSGSPYRTFADLLDAARAKPGGLTLASIGPASAVHIAFEAFKRAAKVDMTFVPYPGASLAINALLGDHVTSFMGNYGDASEQLKAGKLRALAAVSKTRIGALPDVPTVAESGYRDFAMDVWFGLFAPARTPKETVAVLAGWFTAALQAPETRSKLALQGLFPVGTCGAEFAAYLRKQYEQYGRDIRESNIRTE